MLWLAAGLVKPVEKMYSLAVLLAEPFAFFVVDSAALKVSKPEAEFCSGSYLHTRTINIQNRWDPNKSFVIAEILFFTFIITKKYF